MRRSLRTITVVLALVGILHEMASAQNGRASSNASRAVLTIQVQVVSTAMLTKQIAKGNTAVSHAIPVVPQLLSVTEKKELVNVPTKAERLNAVTVVAE